MISIIFIIIVVMTILIMFSRSQAPFRQPGEGRPGAGHHGCWSLQEPLFRNAQLCRSLPFEARQALAEFLVAQQAALWADEQLDQKETPKKEPWMDPGWLWGWAITGGSIGFR